MLLRYNVFSNPQKLDLSGVERTKLLKPFLALLRDNPTEVGRVLFGLKIGPWKKEDVRAIELLIVHKSEDKRMIAGYLSILHEASILWSATTRRRVPLPHYLVPERKFDNPFCKDFATAVSVHEQWKRVLSQMVARQYEAEAEVVARDLRLATLLVSAIVYGGIFGAPFLVALVRAIPEWKRRTFVFDRVHIELSLAKKGVADAEQRIWLPDPLTATLWPLLEPTDADELLAPVLRNGKPCFPGDATVIRRIGRLIDRFREGNDQDHLPGIEELRQCAREVCLSECAPTFVAYNNAELRSESLRRSDVRRLFPDFPLLEFDRSVDAEPQPATVVDPIGQGTEQPEPDWIDLLSDATRSQSVRNRLSDLATDPSVPAALRLVADFGIVLDSRTPRPGKRMTLRKIIDTVIFIARSLGCILGDQDLATLEPLERKAVYLAAINRQSVRNRRDAVQAIREFDLYLVAQNSSALPITRNMLPWLPKDGSVDPSLVTHREYFEITNRIEAEWPVRSGERQRKMVHLLVVLAFRAGLRRSEMRGLRMEDVLVLGFSWLNVRYHKGDPLKTRNAKRRIPIGSFLSDDELQEIRNWFQMRIAEGSEASDYFFTIAEGKRIPNSLFDELNPFLRQVSTYASEGKGLHMHTLRHAAGTWLFVSLMLANSQFRNTIFPALKETHDWLHLGKSLWQHVCGNTKRSKQAPFITAYLCGHASFDTTASSYINIFPWLVAHALDAAESMRPEPELVRKASGVPLKKSKQWHRDGGIHNISVQLLASKGARSRSEVQINPDTIQGAEADWIMQAWRQLVRRSMNEPGLCASAKDQSMIERADWLMKLHNRHGHSRHPREIQPKSKVAIAAPRKPKSAKDNDNSILQNIIALTGDETSMNLSEAVGVFAMHHTRNGFVEFESIRELDAADLYIEFLLQLGFQKRELDIVSGDPYQKSQHRCQWLNSLSVPYLRIRRCSPARNYGYQSSLWVRPSVLALAKRGTCAGGYQFTMAMAFIVFGTIPAESPQTIPATVAIIT
jgi:integrase